jgi:hypothetical protein
VDFALGKDAAATPIHDRSNDDALQPSE